MNDFGIDFAGFRMVGSVLFSYSIPKFGLIGRAVLPFFDEIAAGEFHVFLGEGRFGNGKNIEGGIIALNMGIRGKSLFFIVG
jgi:hypothetical protein